MSSVGTVLGAVPVGPLVGPEHLCAPVVDVTHDSRQVGPGWLYCCVPGSTVDGHDYAQAAAEAGASGLLVERPLDVELPQLQVASTRWEMARAAACVHGDPSHRLTIIGITGTNGKSSTAQIVSDIFAAAGRSTAIVGTLHGPRTTPESTDLQRLFRRFVDEGVEVVAMEVSSHALELGRVWATRFACGIFTNLGRDHLDFHGTTEAYFAAKAKLFSPVYCQQAVINADDEAGRSLIADSTIPVVPYQLSDAEGLRYDGVQSLYRWRGHEVALGLAGQHNVANALAASTSAVALGVAEEVVVAALDAARPVRGRFEMVDEGQPFHVAVDYAHTPDALAAALVAGRQVAGDHRILLVFGCGGDRDAQKRPEMGRVAEQGADVVVVTSDNPRSEPAEMIAAEIVAGLTVPAKANVQLDRRAAIGTALGQARPGDLVLIAGKGHEAVQVIGEETFEFDDVLVASQLLGEMS